MMRTKTRIMCLVTEKRVRLRLMMKRGLLTSLPRAHERSVVRGLLCLDQLGLQGSFAKTVHSTDSYENLVHFFEKSSLSPKDHGMNASKLHSTPSNPILHLPTTPILPLSSPALFLPMKKRKIPMLILLPNCSPTWRLRSQPSSTHPRKLNPKIHNSLSHTFPPSEY